MPAQQTLQAQRNATWGPTLTYDYAGAAMPLAGATIAMQLRLYEGQPGDAQLTLAAVPFADAIIDGTTGQDDERRRLTLLPLVAPAQLAALPHAGEIDDPEDFAFDIRITYADGVSDILARGTFILRAGVTTA